MVRLAPEFPLAGLFKTFFELEDVNAELRDAFAYVGKGRRTRMWFAAFSIQSAGLKPRGFSSRVLKQELVAFLFHRVCSRPRGRRFMLEVEELSWPELEDLPIERFPSLARLVDIIAAVDSDNFSPV